GLTELLESEIEIGVPARVHLVIGIERAIRCAIVPRPQIEEPLPHFTFVARVINVSEVNRELISFRILLDALCADGRAVKPRTPIAEHCNSDGIIDRLSVSGGGQEIVRLDLSPPCKEAACPSEPVF